MIRTSLALLNAKGKRNMYNVFMAQRKSHPDLAGLPIGERAKKLAAMYRELSPEQLAKLKARASK